MRPYIQMLVGLSLVAGCHAETPNPILRHIVVDMSDGSGVRRESVAAEADHFAAEAVFRPGSELRLVFPRENHGATVVSEPIRSDIATLERAASVAEAEQHFRQTAMNWALSQPCGEEDCPTPRVSSDIFGAMGYVARFASGEGSWELVTATNGLQIDECSNFETEVPEPDAYLTCLSRRGLMPDLSAYASIRVTCMSPRGLSQRDADRRDEVWRRVVVDAGGPQPTIEASCHKSGSTSR